MNAVIWLVLGSFEYEKLNAQDRLKHLLDLIVCSLSNLRGIHPFLVWRWVMVLVLASFFDIFVESNPLIPWVSNSDSSLIVCDSIPSTAQKLHDHSSPERLTTWVLRWENSVQETMRKLFSGWQNYNSTNDSGKVLTMSVSLSWGISKHRMPIG